MKKIHVYLVSDSTGETVTNVARSCMAHFDGIIVEEHLWNLFRSEKNLEKLENAIKKDPGIVMHTIVNHEMAANIEKIAKENNSLSIAVLDDVVQKLSSHLKMISTPEAGKQHLLTEEYFKRVDAMNFTLSHDDGQAGWDIESADIILVGVSRTSKSPTCMYLANRGYRAANIPFVYETELPKALFEAKKPFIVGLTINPDRLIQIRTNRLHGLDEKAGVTNYIDHEHVTREINKARRLFAEQRWPVIDVTKRSVEEIAANIIQAYEIRKVKLQK